MPRHRPSLRASLARALGGLLSLALLPALAGAQFDAYDWELYNGTVDGDTLTLEHLVCIGYADDAYARTTAPAKGTLEFDVSATQRISACGSCPGLSICTGSQWYVDVGCECDPFCSGLFGLQPCPDAEVTEEVGGGCEELSWEGHWTVEVEAGACWQLVMNQDGSTLDCDTTVVFSGLVFTPLVEVTAATSAPAYATTAVTLTGTGLDLVTAAELDGASQPILAQSPTSLVLRSGPAEPGFATLTLLGDDGVLATFEGLQLLPTLQAGGASVGGTLVVRLEVGAAEGRYLLGLGLAGLGEPLGLGPRVYHGLLVDPASAVFLFASSADGGAAVPVPVPPVPALSGVEVVLQALAPTGYGAPYAASFTNAVAVPIR